MREYRTKKNPHNPTNRSLWSSSEERFLGQRFL